MWIATIHGFFSAVTCDETGLIKVRARCEEDIRNLHRIIPEAPAPVEWAGTDYQWRILLTEEQWYTALMYFGQDVPTYGNFKDAVKSARHKSAYSRVWWTLLDALQGGRMWREDDPVDDLVVARQALECVRREWDKSRSVCLGCGLTQEDVESAVWVVGPDLHPIRRGQCGDVTVEAGSIEYG